MTTFRVLVGAAVARPPSPANIKHSVVLVDATSATDAQLIAAQMVASRPGVVMPTSTEVI